MARKKFATTIYKCRRKQKTKNDSWVGKINTNNKKKKKTAKKNLTKGASKHFNILKIHKKVLKKRNINKSTLLF